MLEPICVVGAGRAGSALAARLRERGVAVRTRAAGAGTPRTPSSCCSASRTARSPRSRSRSSRGRGSRTSAARRRSSRSSRTGAASASTRCRRSRVRAAPSSSTAPGRPSRRRPTRRATHGLELAAHARRSSRSSSPTTDRPLYHAGAVVASNFLVTLHDAAAELVARRRRAARGARAAHAPHDRERLRADRADRARRLGDRRGAPRASSASGARTSSRSTAPSPTRPRCSPDEDGSETIAERRATALGRLRAADAIGLVPTMGAFHAGHVSLFRAARAENDARRRRASSSTRRSSRPPTISPRTRATRPATRPSPSARASTSCSRRRCDELYPRRLSRRGSRSRGSRERLEGAFRPGHFRGVATVCLKLFNIVRPDAGLLRARRTRSRPRLSSSSSTT